MSQDANMNGVSVEPDEPRAGTSAGEKSPDVGPAFDVRTDVGDDLGDHLRAQIESADDPRYRWAPAPECTQVHAYGEEGWQPGGPGEPHEHMVVVCEGLTADDYKVLAAAMPALRAWLVGDETEKTNPHEDVQVALVQTRERVVAAAVRWVDSPAQTEAERVAGDELQAAVHDYRRAAHEGVGLPAPWVAVDGLSDLQRRAADRLVDDAQRREAARALRDLLYQADVWAGVVESLPDPDDLPLLEAIRRVQRARAEVMPSWMFVETTPDAASSAIGREPSLAKLTQRLRNEVARAARVVDACVDADDRTAANEAVAQVDRTHNELNTAIRSLERRCAAARAKLAQRSASEHTNEASWRSRIAREVYAYADRLEREPENRSLGVALAAIVRQVGDEVGKMPGSSRT